NYVRREKGADAGNGKTYWLHADALGSTSLITNEAGDPAEVTIYKPFGEVFADSPTINERFKFTGQEKDEEAIGGLYYYGKRYYDASLGRFYSADMTGPISEKHPQTLNKYSYVLNNPPTLTDPTGEFPLALVLIFILKSVSGFSLGVAIGGTATAGWLGVA